MKIPTLFFPPAAFGGRLGVGLVLSAFLFSLAVPLYAEQEVTCVIHVHSTRSSGGKSMNDISLLAKKQGVDAVIMTDLLAEDYSYGIGPFKKWVKQTMNRRSIQEFGYENWMREIDEANRAVPEVLVIDGAAVTPFYYWTGSLWQGQLVLNNRSKDVLALGLGSAEAYRNMPVLGTGKSRFDSYMPAPAAAEPYQDAIDYVNRAKGLIYWSHPLAEEHRGFSFFGFRVLLESGPLDSEINETRGYTGMGVYPVELSNFNTPEVPTYITAGQKWDKLLLQHVSGRRKEPVWMIGEVDYNGIAGQNFNLAAILNVLWVEKKTREEVLGALAAGKNYVVIPDRESGRRIVMKDFSVSDLAKGTMARMGGTAETGPAPLVRVHLEFSDGARDTLHVMLIRNTKVVQLWDRPLPAIFEYQDDSSQDPWAHYRVLAWSDGHERLLSNPVFVRRDIPSAA